MDAPGESCAVEEVGGFNPSAVSWEVVCGGKKALESRGHLGRGGSGRHGGAGAWSAELCGMCRGWGQGLRGQEVRGQRPEAVRSHPKRPEGPPLVHSFTLFCMRYTL